MEMHKIVYPETGYLSDDEVMSLAADAYFNHADSYVCPKCGADCTEPTHETVPIYSDGFEKPKTIEDAKFFLDDVGDVTFSKK